MYLLYLSRWSSKEHCAHSLCAEEPTGVMSCTGHPCPLEQPHHMSQTLKPAILEPGEKNGELGKTVLGHT
jgi:hypothetical protein